MSWEDAIEEKFKRLERDAARKAAAEKEEEENKTVYFAFLQNVVSVAFNRFADNLKKRGRKFSIDQARIHVANENGASELVYEIHRSGKSVYPVYSIGGGQKSQSTFRSGSQGFGADTVTVEEVLKSMADAYSPKE